MIVDDDPELHRLREARAPTTRFIMLVAIVIVALLTVALWPRSSAAATACLPTISGDPVGKIGIFENRLGWHGHFYCKADVGGQPGVQGVVWNCLKSNAKCGPGPTLAAYLAVLGASDPAAAARAAWDANFSDTCTGATGDQKLLCDIARFHMCDQWPTDVSPKPAVCAGITLRPIPEPPPPDPGTGWVVAPTSICASIDKEAGKCVRRQSFTWNGSARGTVAQVERATIGSPCIEGVGAAPYFGFDASRTDRVVQCVRK